MIDHWDDAFDQTESYEYDLTGNRISLDRDKGNDGTTDEAITYSYDANDRLLEEVLDDLTAENNDTTTTYGYDRTQQTSKVVTADGLSVSSQSFTYNLHGRMSEAVIDKYATDGTLESRERSSYEYDMRSFRVGQQLEDWNEATGQFEFSSETEFLVSHRNMTGYAQTLRETTTNADGLTKTIDYTFGQDEIAQRVVTDDGHGGATDETHIFGHDGHGSVRVLYDLAGSASGLIEQIITYTSYGSVTAVHGTTGDVIGASEAAVITSLLYSGEAFDHTIQRGYNRARWYDPRSAQWNRLDPFVGNNQDPQSLHKYAYVHGNPVNGIDPTGKFVVTGLVAGIAIVSTGRAREKTTLQIGGEIVLAFSLAAGAANETSLLYDKYGLGKAKGALVGFKLAMGLYLGFRTGKIGEAFAKGVTNVVAKLMSNSIKFAFSNLPNIANGDALDFGGRGVPQFVDDVLTAFSNGMLSGVVEDRPGRLISTIDAGITKVVSEWWDGNFKHDVFTEAGFQEVAESFLEGAYVTAVSSLGGELADFYEADAEVEIAITAALTFIVQTFIEILDFKDPKDD